MTNATCGGEFYIHEIHIGVLVSGCNPFDLFFCVDHGGVKRSQNVDVPSGKNSVVYGGVMFIITYFKV